MSEGLKLSELGGEYNFGDAVAPPEFDPDAKGFAPNPPPGRYVVTILDDPEIIQNHTWRGKDFNEWLGNQLRPRLQVVDGEHAGSQIMDFLPLPVPVSPMPVALANRFANFIGAFGFKPPKDRIVPPGFLLSKLVGPKGIVNIEADTFDGDRQNKARAEGRTPVCVCYFGYEPIPAGGAASQSAAAPVATSAQPAAQAAAPVAAAPAVDFGDL